MALLQDTTDVADSVFTGPPDKMWAKPHDRSVEYDFSAVGVLDGKGADFNVYEILNKPVGRAGEDVPLTT